MGENSYKFERIKDGFIVSKPGQSATTVMAVPTGFNVLSDGFFASKFGLFQFYAISESVSERLTAEWQSPVLHSKLGYTPERLKQWRRECAAKAIGKRLHAEWLNLLAKADPRIRELQRKIFSISRTCPEIAHDGRLYSDAIVRDAMKYRAAAIAIVIPEIIYKHRGGDFDDHLPRMRLHLEQNKAINFFDLLLEWRSIYSDTGSPYRSLDRTLMNLPGRVPLDLLAILNYVHLRRPLTDRVELTTLLERYSLAMARESSGNILDVWHNARRDQIVRAMCRVGEHLRTPLSPNKRLDISTFVSFVMDGEPDSYAGGLVGLAERSIDYHRNHLSEYRELVLKKLGGQTKTAIPSVPLPQLPGIRFLSTVEEIVAEGHEMSHCIANYAKGAVRGRSYLFHVERNGEHASVQVVRGGVAQSYGPMNRINDASIWGKRVLSPWARSLKTNKRKR